MTDNFKTVNKAAENRFKLAAKKAAILEQNFLSAQNEKSINESTIAQVVCIETEDPLSKLDNAEISQQPTNRFFFWLKRGWASMKRFYRKCGMKHIGLILILVAYSCLGGWLFSKLEYENEMRKKLVKNQTSQLEAFNVTSLILQRLKNHENSPSINIDVLNRTIYNIVVEYQMQKNFYSDNKVTWDFWGGMFFAGTVYTTIGYGHYAPVTDNGRLAVMIYALFGIPLLLTLLADWGTLLTWVLNAFWTKVGQTVAYLFSKMARFEKHLPTLIVAQSSEFAFPIPIALMFIFGWIFFCSSLFCLWETTWRYFDAFYFFVISLSTVGLGDITPNHPKYMICNFPLVIIGLTLVTLVINLIQNKIVELKQKATQMLEYQFGLDMSDSECQEYERTGQIPDRIVDPADQDQQTQQRTTLGVIQTIKHRVIVRRRRIGVQTDESCFQSPFAKTTDLNHNDNINKSPELQPLLLDESLDLVDLSMSGQKLIPGSSRETLYFDAPY